MYSDIYYIVYMYIVYGVKKIHFIYKLYTYAPSTHIYTQNTHERYIVIQQDKGVNGIF